MPIEPPILTEKNALVNHILRPLSYNPGVLWDDTETNL